MIKWIRCPKCGGPVTELDEHVYACAPCSTKYDILVGKGSDGIDLVKIDDSFTRSVP